MLDEKRITGIARLDVAIARIAGAAVADGLCEAVLLKGSIARGDADEFSDIDLYLVVSPQNRDAGVERREKYLSAYGDVVFVEDVDFGLPQKVAIFSDALHVDLYVAEPKQVGSLDPVVAAYDPASLFADVTPTRAGVTDEALSRHFSSALYCLVEASSAYGRGNDAWAAKIMSDAVGELSVLVRSLYDRRYAFLGLKKINEVIPAEDYRLLEDVYASLGCGPDHPRRPRRVSRQRGQRPRAEAGRAFSHVGQGGSRRLALCRARQRAECRCAHHESAHVRGVLRGTRLGGAATHRLTECLHLRNLEDLGWK